MTDDGCLVLMAGMSSVLTTLRWKLSQKDSNLTPADKVVLSDLITEKLGYEAPDIDKEDAEPEEPPAKEQETPADDPYQEVFLKSPNQGGTIKPKFIVIHDSYGSHDGTKSWILQSKSKVSYHYLIDSQGNRTQFVHDTKRAWHAGRSYWKGHNGLNGHSVGVAFHGNTYERTPNKKEIDSCAHKCLYLMKKFKLGRDAVITHAMIAPNRKNDTSPKTYEKVLARIDELSA